MKKHPQKRLGIGKAFLAILRAIKMIFQHPKLLVWLLIPLGITLALDGLILYFAYGTLSEWILSFLPQEGWFWGSFQFLSKLIISAMILFLLALTFTFVYLTLSSPFQEYLSEDVEKIVRGHTIDPEEEKSSMLRGLYFGLRETFILLLLEIPFLFLGLIPLIGPVLLFLWNILLLGYAFFHIPTGRKAKPFAQKRKLTRRHMGATIGLGLPATLSNLLPIIHIFFLPVFVVAGTLLYIDTLPENLEKP